jgi:anti-sigma factor RsiW
MTQESCPRIEALSALVDDALTGPERAAIEAHAAICPVCGASLARLNELRASFAALPAPRVGFDLATAVEGRIRAAERPQRARPVRERAHWWQALPAAVGAAAALSGGAYLGSFLVAGGGAVASRSAIEMSAFGTVPPGGICLGAGCGPGGQ